MLTDKLKGALRENTEAAHIFLFPNLPLEYTLKISGEFPQVWS